MTYPYPKVILIGPDCGGKSTLAKHLREYYNVGGAGNRRVEGDLQAVREVLRFALDEIPNSRFILDQWQYPVDIVYRHAIEDDESPVSVLDKMLVPYLKEQKVLFIHVTASPQELLRRFSIRGDELWTGPQIVAVAEDYHTYLKCYAMFDYVTIDTTGRHPKEVLKEAVYQISKYYKGADEE